MSADYFILVDREVRPVSSWDEFAAWHDAQPGKHPAATFQVAYSDVGEVRVSTVFLPIDHGYDDGPPVVFETMTFGDPYEQLCWRYRTLDEAEAGHAAIVAALEAGTDLRDFEP